MTLSVIIFLSLALWIILWAFGIAAIVAFLIALAIILPAVAFHVVRSGPESGS